MKIELVTRLKVDYFNKTLYKHEVIINGKSDRFIDEERRKNAIRLQ